MLRPLLIIPCFWLASVSLFAASPRALPEGDLPKDARLGPLRHLSKDYFPFQKIKSAEAWQQRANALRRQVLVATGLWPQPTKTPLHATVHTPVQRDGYTVWRVFFESMPGHYVTGSLYRPKNQSGRLPAVLTPHGHSRGGRFHRYNDAELKEQIAIGAERFLEGGRYPAQSRCVQLVRMGCVVFQYDMDGYSDSVQRVNHRNGVRKQMNTTTDWGLASPQAELHLQNLMGLQTWNSIRAFDFLSNLPDVDPKRIVVTGYSGGGTQTFILTAVDDRPAAAIPCVMVSTAMQGGCICENAPYLRIGAGNIDLAALTAPRPMGLTAADDWTVDLETKGYPDLLELYSMLGHKDRLRGVFHTHFKHNYNSVNRMFMYGCVNDFLDLGFEKPILERDLVPLTQEEQSVWTADHPAPSGDQKGEVHERAMLRWWKDDAKKQLENLRENSAAYADVAGSAWDVLIGRRLEDVGDVQLQVVRKTNLGKYQGKLALLTDNSTRQQLPALLLSASVAEGGESGRKKQVVIWLTDSGKSGLLNTKGAPNSAVCELLDAGYMVVGVDLLYQGEFLTGGEKLTHTRLNHLYPEKDNKNREPWEFFSGYTFGYNPPLFSQRVHDGLVAIRAFQTGPQQAAQIHLVGQGKQAGAIALATRVQAGSAITKTAAVTEGFRFASVQRFDDPMFVPGAVKYDDVDGLVRLVGDAPIWSDHSGMNDPVTKLVQWIQR